MRLSPHQALRWAWTLLKILFPSLRLPPSVPSLLMLLGTSPHVDVFWLPSPACSNIVPRSAWEARKTHCPKMNLPAKYVVIFHTAGRTCIMSDECHLLVQDIQSFFIDRLNSCDIGYNFLVGQDGVIYEGVGWNVQGSRAPGYNDIALGIAFMGTFLALEAAQNLIQCAVDKGYLTPNYLLVGHSDIVNTLSPGEALYNIIKTWPHFKH
uniref:Peptidoglycan recognition protein 4-like n=1 Tax=Lynx canadensis TaxID=61383 RepID=A0A667FLM1_LYNCA